MNDTTASPRLLKLGTRGSFLARTQSQWVADRVRELSAGVDVELRIVKTTGDQIADRPLHDLGGKGLFTRELELALLAGDVDFAVHSFKDVPVTMPLVDQSDLVIVATPPREDPRDVLASLEGRALAELPSGARVGTGSLRRRSQLLARRPDLRIEPIRGNIDTRLRKLREGAYDAIVLAMAGLKRSSLFDSQTMRPLSLDELLPAAGQGALAIQCRRTDEAAVAVLARLNDEKTALCVAIEREVVRRLEGDCHSPIAALAHLEGDRLTLQVVVGGQGGEGKLVRAGSEGVASEPDRLIEAVCTALFKQGAREMLHPPT